MPTNDEIREWIELIREKGYDLSVWEENFVDSVSEQLESKGFLSERQIKILERIYSDKTLL